MANTAGGAVTEVAGALVSMRIDELISSMAIGIAEGQMALDDACREIAQFMGTAQIDFGKRPGTDEPERHSLIELGFTPTFYQFVDTILEVRVAVTTQYEETQEIKTKDATIDEQASQTSAVDQYNSSSYGQNYGYGYRYGRRYHYGYGGSSSSSASTRTAATQRKTVRINTVDGTYASMYNYAVEGSSVIKTKLVPIPPPNVLEEMIRDRARLAKIETDNALRRAEAKTAVPAAQTALGLLKDMDVMKGMNLTPTRVKDFGNGVDAVVAELNKLTRDHWVAIGAEATGAKVAAAVDALNANKASLAAKVDTDDSAYPDEKASNATAATTIGDALAAANTKLYPPAAA